MDWNGWINKKVFVQLTDGKVYNGLIIDIEENDIGSDYKKLVFITLIDKFDKKVFFSTSQIIRMVDETQEGKA